MKMGFNKPGVPCGSHRSDGKKLRLIGASVRSKEYTIVTMEKERQDFEFAEVQIT